MSPQDPRDQEPDDRGTGGHGITARAAHGDLAVRLADFARSVQKQEGPHETLVEIVRAAVDLIPGTDEGSISVVMGRRRMLSEAASDDLPRRVDALQEALGQGPCLDAIHEQEVVRVPDLATDERWPQFSQQAVQAGAAGMLSFQLHVQEDSLGALNLFSREAGAFDEESEHVGLLFAAHAALAYSAAKHQERTSRAVSTRGLIGQAQGVLMERLKLTPEQAFTLLVQTSQQTNTKLRDVADGLVHSGVLPPTA